GADLTIDPFTEDVEKRLEEEKVGRIACVIECVGKIGTLRQAIAIAGQKATVMMFGLTAPEDELPIRPFELFKKELTLKTSYINPYTQKRALRLIDSGKIDVSSMIFRREPLEALPQVLSDATLRSQGKFLILP
ncbi:MAG: zinc-binding dehydrogenase, partial [Clostridia bacterium]|nr:zinc-binding dehydrogenase [Clostridia bacterium]